ncbi:MAG: ABC transporter ATP-binding protein [Methylovulum sp.]|nr:ABC transporter ATP-binding protein [Methylovulum sp.]
MPALLEAQRLYRYYGKHCAVNDVSFTLRQGEVLGFLGPNGAGKTTTMQMLCGVLAPSAGRIHINGFDLLAQPIPAKQQLGVCPDTPPLYRELTVVEFLAYCAQLHGLNPRQIRPAIDRAIQRCGLTTVHRRLIAHLSKGFQQRVGIAQAILHNPDIIILDEPTVGLDPLQISEIRSLIRELGHDHGIILSTHRLSEVQESCTHVQIIHQGRLILNESIAALNQLMDTGIVQITTRLEADVGLLSAIPGINAVENLTENRIRIHYSVTSNPIPRLTETIINAGWELQELTPVKKSMEDLFISLIRDNEP